MKIEKIEYHFSDNYIVTFLYKNYVIKNKGIVRREMTLTLYNTLTHEYCDTPLFDQVDSQMAIVLMSQKTNRKFSVISDFRNDKEEHWNAPVNIPFEIVEGTKM